MNKTSKFCLWPSTFVVNATPAALAQFLGEAGVVCPALVIFPSIAFTDVA
jgi:hypothetical protein